MPIDAPETEVENVEKEILDQATASETLVELKAEIETLTRLETLADERDHLINYVQQ